MSSPARPARADTYFIGSSSPDLPPLHDILGVRKSPKRPTLRSGSNAVPIPVTARQTFATAAEILRDAPEIDIDTEQITHSPPRKAKPARKPRARGPQPKGAPSIASPDAPLAEALSPNRFKRRKASSDNKQPALAQGRVTKPIAPDKKGKKKADAVPQRAATPSEPEQALAAQQLTHSGTPPPRPVALARRTDWTPPAADPITIPDSESEDAELPSPSEKATASKDVFHNLYNEYACKSTERGPRPEPAKDVLRKRKRLELVETGDSKVMPLVEAPSLEAPPLEAPSEAPQTKPSPTKTAAPKKKARTLTELATAPYAQPEAPEIDLLAPGNEDSLLRYFDTDGHVKALVEHQAIVMDRASSKAKKPAKKPAKSRKKKAGTVEEPILLSPNSALKVSTNQDFVFGTSSQLVLEDSPTMLRDLQAAMQASNRLDPEDDPFASSPADQARRRGLWHASARDMDGDLLAAETMDLITTPVATRDKEAARSEQIGPREDEFVDIRDICSSSPRAVPPSTNPGTDSWQSKLPSAGSGTTPTTEASGSSSTALVPPSNESQAATPRPKFELFTDAQLARQITTYGFKPVKKRQAMIALLDQCWTSQHPGSSSGLTNIGSTAALSTLATRSSPKKSAPRRTSPEVPSTATGPAKKPRGRPKKDASPEVINPVSPNRGRGRPRKASADAVSPNKGPGRPRKASVDAARSISPNKGRGRPRKGSIGAAESVSPSRGPGRPRKASVDAVSPNGGRGRPRKASISPAKSVSPNRGRGRPRKQSIDAAGPVSSNRGRGRPRKVSVDTVSPNRKPGRPRKASVDSISPDRKPGRPRKASVDSISPNRKPGRPRKASVVGSGNTSNAPVAKAKAPVKQKRTAQKVIEIADSDDDEALTTSCPSSPERVFSSPPQVDLSMADENDVSLNLTPTDQETSMFVHITRAITSAPPSKDAANPSWHEQILLYDPVVLEDLAAWLNSGQLTRVGYDSEVSPVEVKKWCESKSVVCLWRKNLRGKERKRY